MLLSILVELFHQKGIFWPLPVYFITAGSEFLNEIERQAEMMMINNFIFVLLHWNWRPLQLNFPL